MAAVVPAIYKGADLGQEALTGIKVPRGGWLVVVPDSTREDRTAAKRGADRSVRRRSRRLDVYAGLFGDDLDAVAAALDGLVPQVRHTKDDDHQDDGASGALNLA